MRQANGAAAGLYIFGFGGHARSVADVAVAAGYSRIVFIDPKAKAGESFAGFPARASLDGPEAGWAGFVALGDSAARRRLTENLPVPLATLIAPSATVGLEAVVGEGAFVGSNAHVGPGAGVGRGAIVNTGAVVEHEVTVGEFAHVSVNATVAGRCRVGANTMIGAGATVIDGVSVGDDIIVGAGATVVGDLRDPGTYVGTPARRIERG